MNFHCHKYAYSIDVSPLQSLVLCPHLKFISCLISSILCLKLSNFEQFLSPSENLITVTWDRLCKGTQESVLYVINIDTSVGYEPFFLALQLKFIMEELHKCSKRWFSRILVYENSRCVKSALQVTHKCWLNSMFIREIIPGKE